MFIGSFRVKRKNASLVCSSSPAALRPRFGRRPRGKRKRPASRSPDRASPLRHRISPGTYPDRMRFAARYKGDLSPQGTARSGSDRANRGISTTKRRLGVTNRRRVPPVPARQLRTHSDAVVHVPLVCQTPRSPAQQTLLRRRRPALPVLRSRREPLLLHPLLELVVDGASSGAKNILFAPVMQQHVVRYVRKRP